MGIVDNFYETKYGIKKEPEKKQEGHALSEADILERFIPKKEGQELPPEIHEKAVERLMEINEEPPGANPAPTQTMLSSFPEQRVQQIAESDPDVLRHELEHDKTQKQLDVRSILSEGFSRGDEGEVSLSGLSNTDDGMAHRNVYTAQVQDAEGNQHQISSTWFTGFVSEEE